MVEPRVRAPRIWKGRELPPDGFDAAPDSWAVPPWQKVLGAVLRARSAAASASVHERPRPSVARGCLGRLAIVVLLFALGLGAALYFFAHSLLQSFSTY